MLGTRSPDLRGRDRSGDGDRGGYARVLRAARVHAEPGRRGAGSSGNSIGR